MRNLEILNEDICGPTLTETVRATFPLSRSNPGRAKRPR
jgi:hypothetical protein